MADEPTNTSGLQPGSGSAVAFNEEQRSEFRAAGLWMKVVGWLEVLAGSAMAVAWLLGLFGFVPQDAQALAGATPAERGTAGIQAVGTMGIGVLTLIAATSFRRVAGPTDDALAAATKAAADLKELYARQVLFFAVLIAAMIAISVFTQ